MMTATEEAAFHNAAVGYARDAHDALRKGDPVQAQVWAQLSTTYAIMAQSGLLDAIWRGPIVPPS